MGWSHNILKDKCGHKSVFQWVIQVQLLCPSMLGISNMYWSGSTYKMPPNACTVTVLGKLSCLIGRVISSETYTEISL